MLLPEQDPEVGRAGDGREGRRILYAGHRVAATVVGPAPGRTRGGGERLSSELLLSYRAVASVVLESSAAQRVPGFCAKHNSLAACNTLGKQARRKLHAKEAHVGAGDAYTYISDHLFVGASAAVAARTNSYSKTPEHKTSPRIDRRRGRRRTYLLQTLSTKERQPRSTPSSRDART